MPSFVEKGIVPLCARSRLAIDHIASEIGGTGITLAAFKMHEIGVMAKTVIVLAIALQEVKVKRAALEIHADRGERTTPAHQRFFERVISVFLKRERSRHHVKEIPRLPESGHFFGFELTDIFEAVFRAFVDVGKELEDLPFCHAVAHVHVVGVIVLEAEGAGEFVAKPTTATYSSSASVAIVSSASKHALRTASSWFVRTIMRIATFDAGTKAFVCGSM